MRTLRHIPRMGPAEAPMRAGFSMLEVMVAAVVLFAAIITYVGALGASSQVQRRTQGHARVYDAIQRKIEEIQSLTVTTVKGWKDAGETILDPATGESIGQVTIIDDQRTGRVKVQLEAFSTDSQGNPIAATVAYIHADRGSSN